MGLIEWCRWGGYLHPEYTAPPSSQGPVARQCHLFPFLNSFACYFLLCWRTFLVSSLLAHCDGSSLWVKWGLPPHDNTFHSTTHWTTSTRSSFRPIWASSLSALMIVFMIKLSFIFYYFNLHLFITFFYSFNQQTAHMSV